MKLNFIVISLFSSGSLSLNLNQMPRGSKLACNCTLEGMERAKKINLFALTSIRAWWPLKTIDMNTGRDLPAVSIGSNREVEIRNLGG